MKKTIDVIKLSRFKAINLMLYRANQKQLSSFKNFQALTWQEINEITEIARLAYNHKIEKFAEKKENSKVYLDIIR